MVKGITPTPPASGGALEGFYFLNEFLRQESAGEAVDVHAEASGHNGAGQGDYAIPVGERHGLRIDGSHRGGQRRRLRSCAIMRAVAGDEMVDPDGIRDGSDAFEESLRVLDGQQGRDGNHHAQARGVKLPGRLETTIYRTRRRR